VKKHTFELTAAVIVLATVLFCAAIILFSLRDSQIEIQMPPEPTADETIAGDLTADINVISVTADTVQNVIETLARPAEYSRDIMVERFWDGGNSATNLRVEVADGATLIRTTSGGIEQNVIVTPERTYIWYAGDREPYTYTAGAEPDKYAKIITYEDILKLDKSEILDSSYIETNGGEILVLYAAGELGYITECRISIELGLLTSAEVYDGDLMIYRMVTGVTVLEAASAPFKLPNGRAI